MDVTDISKAKEACLDLNLPNSRNGAFAKFINTARREVDELSKLRPDVEILNSDQNAEAQSKVSTLVNAMSRIAPQCNIEKMLA